MVELGFKIHRPQKIWPAAKGTGSPAKRGTRRAVQSVAGQAINTVAR
jgi:hypothetical protein